MLGQERSQRSFFDAEFAVEDLLEAGSFYREGRSVLRWSSTRLLQISGDRTIALS